MNPDPLIDVVLDTTVDFAKDKLDGDTAHALLEILAQLGSLGLKAAVREALTTRMKADGVDFHDHTAG